MKTLQRKPIDLDNEPDPVIDEARHLLDYRCNESSRVLEKAIAKIGLQPLVKETVERYKERKRLTGVADWPMYAMGVCLFVAGITGLFGLIGGLFYLFDSLRSDMTVGGIAVVPLLIHVVAFALSIAMFVTAGVISEKAEWVKVRIDNYDKPVPEFVLATAVALKRACPEVGIYVEEIRKTANKDPFLIAELNGAIYYLEVWNEPGFKQKREV